MNKNYISKGVAILIATLFFSACTRQEGISYLETACKSGALPHLSEEDDRVLLSWVAYVNDTTDAINYSFLDEDKWSKPYEVDRSSRWFINWADYPTVVLGKNQDVIIAHWLQYSGSRTYDYDIMMRLSTDAGSNWSEAFKLHKDSVIAEHGFVSIEAMTDTTFYAVWLDGRHTAGHHSHDDHGHGAMSLRGAYVNTKGQVYNSVALDERVCDCCQTTATYMDSSIWIAYRDRSAEEIRDISIIKYNLKDSVNTMDTSNDNWLTSACPVNGPSMDSNGDNIAIAWFTMVNDKPKVKMRFSTNGGASFSDDILVDSDNPVGRVKLVYDDNSNIYVCWIGQKDDHYVLMLNQYDNKGTYKATWDIDTLAHGRISGFPALACAENKLIVAWTQDSENPYIKSAIIEND